MGPRIPAGLFLVAARRSVFVHPVRFIGVACCSIRQRFSPGHPQRTHSATSRVSNLTAAFNRTIRSGSFPARRILWMVLMPQPSRRASSLPSISNTSASMVVGVSTAIASPFRCGGKMQRSRAVVFDLNPLRRQFPLRRRRRCKIVLPAGRFQNRE